MEEYLRGIILGFSIAAPVGPIGLLCIRRTLVNGRLAGFLSGMGAATADALYGGVAAFGLAAVSNLLIEQQNILRLLGGIFLVYLGIKAFLSHPSPRTDEQDAAGGRKNLAGAYFSTLLLTLSNPLTILSFVAVFAGLGIGAMEMGPEEAAWLPATYLVAGVFSGSALWWLTLSQVVGWFRARLLGAGLVWINRLSGILIVAFGIIALLGTNGNNQTITSRVVVPTSDRVPSPLTGYAFADGSQPLVFPRDHGAHPDYQTEWWYYTGNISDQDGSRFGYQLTFFRRALISPSERSERDSAWATDQAYMAHFALTDGPGNKHYSFERLERGAAGIAGALPDPFEVWLKNWQVIQTDDNTYRLLASVPPGEGNPEILLDLTLIDLKGPVLQGEQGYSRKGPQPGNASYYYSFTRLDSKGTIRIGNQDYTVGGYSWMDHEFSTSALSSDQVGWDWFSIQLDNNYELMLFQIRRDDGSIDPYSSGMLIAPDGSTRLLSRDDFELEVTDTWRSPTSGAVYPSRWEITIPEQEITLQLQPLVADQELNLRYKYWEGAVSIQGSFGTGSVDGFGYVELTGYAGSMGGEF